MAWGIMAGVIGLSAGILLLWIKRAPKLPDDDVSGFSDRQRAEHQRMKGGDPDL